MKAQLSLSSSLLALLALQIAIYHVDVNFAGTADMGGMYELIIQRIVECEGIPSPKLNFSTQINNPEDGKRFLSGNFTFDLEMGPTELLKLDVSKWGQNAGYQKNAYHLEKEYPCTFLRTDFPNIFDNLFVGMNISDCPISKGNYELKYMALEGWSLKKISSLPYGEYRLDVVILSGDETVACLQIYVDVKQKAKENPAGF